MSHEARLDRLEGSTTPENTPELDAAIHRGIEELKRAHPDTWEDLLAEVIAQTRTKTDING